MPTIAENAGENTIETMPEKSTIKRTIGVEIECLVPEYYGSLEEDLNEIGAKTGSDGSIDGEGEGVEVKLGPVKGDDAEKMIREACDRLDNESAETNSSCGMHVHVDARELDINKFMREFYGRENLVEGETILYVDNEIEGRYHVNERYLDVLACVELQGTLKCVGAAGAGRVVWAQGNEPDIDTDGILRNATNYTPIVARVNELGSLRTRIYNAMRFFSAVDSILRSLIPSSRRHNTYCQSFEKMARSGGRCPNTTKELLQGVRDRYCGINLQALSAHGTVENRYHGGTIESTKIIHWARLWERCVDVALSRSAEEEADAISEVVNGKNRLEMLLALTGVPESTEKYMLSRYARFMGSDTRHAISYVKNKKARRIAAQY